MAAQFVWGVLVSGTVINAWVLSQYEQGDSRGSVIEISSQRWTLAGGFMAMLSGFL
jgi:hypothetical protein